MCLFKGGYNELSAWSLPEDDKHTKSRKELVITTIVQTLDEFTEYRDFRQNLIDLGSTDYFLLKIDTLERKGIRNDGESDEIVVRDEFCSSKC